MENHTDHKSAVSCQIDCRYNSVVNSKYKSDKMGTLNKPKDRRRKEERIKTFIIYSKTAVVGSHKKKERA